MSIPIQTAWLTTENGDKLAPKTLVSQVQTNDGILLEDKIKNDYIPSSQKGNANGIAELDSNGKVPTSQLPSYVDDVIEASSKSAFPATGESGKIYVDLATNKTYRWSGSAYTEISASLAIGTTASTAAAGNHGHDNATTSKSGFMSTTDKSKLDGIETGANKITVDSSLSSTSTNPVQNKVVDSALSDKVDKTTTINGHALSENVTITKSDVNLSNVVNTGDSATPVSGGTTKFTTGGAYTELNKKVDKISGKGLSTNDYTTNEKNKLAGIDTGANKTIVDSSLSSSSTNPVQNKVVNSALNNKMNTSNPTGTGSFSMNRSYGSTIGNYSFAEGLMTTASGKSSHAEGSYTTASRGSSHAEGYNTIASGDSSHAEGYNTNYGFTISGDANATTYSTTNTYIKVGYIITYNNITATITTIDKENGTFTVDKTLSDIAISNVNASYKAGGASGDYSHSEGRETTASGETSHSEGRETTASGDFVSHAEGYNTIASGDSSHAEGEGTIASGPFSHVQGTYNIENTSGKYAHIVGNGYSNNDRSNAHTLDWNGNAWFKGELKIGGTSQDDTNAKKIATEVYVNEQITKTKEEINSIKELCGSLNKDAANLLINILRQAHYNEDVSQQITRLSELLGKNTNNGGVDIQSIKMGIVAHDNGVTKLQATWSDRATLVPMGQYLENGKTYKFGIGNIANKYRYCVQIFKVDSAGLTFPYVPDATTQYDKLSTRIVDTGWIDSDFIYTPNTDNCVFTVNFQTPDRVILNESNYEEIFENLMIEKFIESDDVQYRFIINRGLRTLNDGSAAIAASTNTLMAYSANIHDRVYQLHNGQWWDKSPYSPIKIPAGATGVVVDMSDNMRYSVITYENSTTNQQYVKQIANSGWIANGGMVDVSGYNDGNHYIGIEIGYTNASAIPEDFDTSTIDIYFVDADGNRMS